MKIKEIKRWKAVDSYHEAYGTIVETALGAFDDEAYLVWGLDPVLFENDENLRRLFWVV